MLTCILQVDALVLTLALQKLPRKLKSATEIALSADCARYT